MSCPSCQADVPQGARFCPSCGSQLTVPDLDEVRKTVTALFCDMAGSTALSERLDLEVLRNVMLRYFAAMRECLERHGGTVEKFIGDAVMAVFGVPAVHEDDALRAVRAAVDMTAALDDLNRELNAEIGIRLAIRIGINTGEVVASPGPTDSMSASGEAINIAARLEERAEPGEILMGPDTYRVVVGAVMSEPVGPVRLKGVSRAFTAYRLLDLNPDSPAVVRRFDLPLVNRDQEMTELSLVLDQAIRNGACHMVTIYGDAGVGKSRLAREFIGAAERRDADVAVGSCQPDGEGASLRVLADTLRPLLDRWNSTDPSADADPSADQGPDHGADQSADQGPDHGADQSAGQSADDAEAAAILRDGMMRDGTPGAAVAETSWALSRLLDGAAARRPVLVVMDDLHWADPLLLDVLTQVADRLTDAPVVLLCLARTDFLVLNPAWGGGRPESRSLLLRPLTAPESRLFVSALGDVMPHEQDVVERIVERAEGNPFFAEQLVAIMREGAPPTELPTTINLLISARLDMLPAAERAALQVASVVGRTFTLAAVRAIQGNGADPRPAIEALSRRRLVRAAHRAGRGDIAYRFTSGLIHEVAYRALPKLRRARLHELLAEHFLAQDADAVELIGTQLEKAYRNLSEVGRLAPELGDRAAEQLGLAGTRALRRGDVSRAGALLERALELARSGSRPRRPGLMVTLGETRIATGEADEGRLLLREARGAAGGDALVAAHANLLLAYLENPDDQVAAAAATARDALPVFEAGHDELGLARAWTRIGHHRQFLGRYDEALGVLGKGLTYAVAADDELERATALAAMAVSLWLGTEPAESAIGRCDELMAAHAEGRRTVRAALLCSLAVLRAMTGEFGTARDLIGTARTIVEELGHAFAAAAIPMFAAAVEGLAGDWAVAERLLRGAAEANRDLGDAQARRAADAELARALLWQGRDLEAMALAEATLRGDEATPDGEEATPHAMPTMLAALCGIVARVLAGRNLRDAALMYRSRSLEAAARTDSLVCQAGALLDSAWTLHALDDHQGANAAAHRALLMFRRKGHTVGVEWASALCAGRWR